MRNTLSPRQANPATPEEIYRLAALTGRQWKRVAEKARKGDPAAAAAVELRRRMGELRRERERRRYGAAGTGRYDWDYGPAALKRRAASRRERTAIETAVRRWTECPAARYWSKTQLQRVRDAARYAAQGIGGDPESAAARATIDAMVRRMVKRGWQRRHTSKEGGRATSRYLRKGDFEVRLSDHRVPQTAQREYRGPAGWYDFDELDPCGDVEAQIDYIERYAEGARRRGNYSASRSPRRSARGVVDDLFDDPSLSGPAMQKHLRAIKARAGSAARRSSRGATAEWEEFAGYSPNHVEEIDGVALSGNLPGVRVDVLKGVGQKTGRAVEIDASKKALWLVWFNSGERFALTGGPSAMRELARDFARLREPVILTQVDYVALRNPVPEGVRRTKANADWAAAFTHAVENPTVLSWNGKSDPRKARFDIRVQGRRRRWVNRSGLIF